MSKQQNEYIHGGDIWKKENPHAWLDFSANINPLGMPGPLRAAIKSAGKNIGYYPDPYAAGAIGSVAKYLRTGNENLLLTNGGIEALRIACEHFASRHCLLPVPCFCEYIRFAQNAGAEIEFVNAIKTETEYATDLEAIKRKMRPGSLVFLCNPANPTGSVIDRELVREFLLFAARAGSFVIIDEAFIDFCPTFSSRDDIAGFDNVIIAGSLTKFFAVPGLRLGYVCANKRTITAIKRKMPPWNVNAFALAAAQALAGTAVFSEKTRIKTEKNKLYLKKQLIALGFTVYDSNANYLLVNGENNRITAKALNGRLEEHFMMIRDCANFEGLGIYDCRVAVKSRKDNEKLIAAVRSVLQT